MRRLVFIGLALAVLAPGVALAQTSSGTTVTTAPSTPSLSPGNQKIAEAILAAATTPSSPTTTFTTSGSTTTTTTAPKTLTLDRIAAMKQSGMGWGRVFQTLKAEGLVQGKNLGQVVSAYEHSLQSGTAYHSTGATLTTASGHTYVADEPRGHGESGSVSGSTTGHHGPTYSGGGGHDIATGGVVSAGSGHGGGAQSIAHGHR